IMIPLRWPKSPSFEIIRKHRYADMTVHLPHSKSPAIIRHHRSGDCWVIAGGSDAMGARLTKRVVEAADAGASDRYLWDAEVKCFGLKIPRAGRKVFVFQYRMGGRGVRTERYTIGEYKSPYTVDGARGEAVRLLAEVKAGRTPAEAKRRGDASRERLFG